MTKEKVMLTSVTPKLDYSASKFAKRWKTAEVQNVVFKQSSNQKRYTSKGMNLLIQTCGLFKCINQSPESVIKMDASTQTDFNYYSSPEAPQLTKIENCYRTPEMNKLSPKFCATATPKNIKLVFNQINLATGPEKNLTVSQRKLRNVITPKRIFLNNCNNFNLPPQVPIPIFDNVTPVSSKNWHENNVSTKENQRHPTPKFYKVLRKTRALHKKYKMAMVKLLKDARSWFKKICKFSDEVDKVPINNLHDLQKNQASNNNEMFQYIKQEIEELKIMIQDLKTNEDIASKTKMETVPIITITPSLPERPLLRSTNMAAAPPPPPPPPPPILVPSNRPPIIAKASGDRNTNKQKQGEMRPAISLNDILSVKLRKPCERSQTLPKSNSCRILRGPVVTLDALKQVRLKPASKISTSLCADSINSPIGNVSNSPVSSLKRLLTNGVSSESRPKRMRHCYSKTSAIDRERFTEN